MLTRHHIVFAAVLGLLHGAFPTRGHTPLSKEHRLLLMCVRNIMHQHFILRNSILVSLPSTSQDYQHRRSLTDVSSGNNMLFMDIILETINEDSKWNIYISRPDIETLNAEFNMHDHYDANIIFTWPVERENKVLANLLEQMEDINVHPLWNPRALLLVVIICSSDSPEIMAQTVLTNIWETYRITDILLLIADAKPCVTANGNCALKENTSEIYKFPLFSWQPFNTNNKLSVVDVFVHEVEGSSPRQIALFPSKIPKNFNGFCLNVSALYMYPVFVYSRNDAGDGNQAFYTFTGPEVAILKLILETLNLRGFYQLSSSPESSVAKLLFKEADLVVGGVVTLHELPRIIDLVFPYFMTGVRMYVPCPQPAPRLQKISQIFDLPLWLGICLVFVFVVISFLYLAKRPFNKHIYETQHYQTLSNCCYNIWAVTLGVSVTEQPRTDKLRAVFLLFVWYSFAVSTVFQTFFTSVLVDPGMENQISSLDELLFSSMEYGYSRNISENLLPFLKDWNSSAFKARKKYCVEYESCLTRIIEDRDYASLVFELYVDHFVATNYPKSPNILCYIEEYIMQFSSTMYLQKRSPFLESFNWVVYRALQAGLIDKYYADSRYAWRMQGLSNMSESDGEGNSDEGYFVFSLSHLEIAYMALLIGVCFSLFILILEIVHFQFIP